MNKFITAIITSSVMLVTAPVYADDSQALVTAYIKHAQVIVDMVNTKTVSASKVKAAVEEMTKSSVALSVKYRDKHPAGKKLLSMTENEAAEISNGKVIGIGPMINLTFKEIEDTWHDLGFIETHDTGIDMDDEDNEHFTDPLHVMVHPIMTLRAAMDYENDRNEKHLDLMKAEISEGMEQAKVMLETME